MRNLLPLLLLVGCVPDGVAGAHGLFPIAHEDAGVVDAARDSSDLATPLTDMADARDLRRVDMAPMPPDMFDPHFGCIGLKCEIEWCTRHGVGLGCDESVGWLYCAVAGTDCHIDADCCTPRGGRRTCRFGRCL